jgi:organizing structure protein 2
MDSVLDLENSFTSTIASLAPPRESGEKLMPGTIYVLVAAMAGSIVTRNRNIFVRGAIPLAVGIGAGWVVLPVTMGNVSELIWKYEQKIPALADAHLRTRSSIQKAWYMTRVHTEQAVRIVDEKVGEGREAVEGWVRKGK